MNQFGGDWTQQKVEIVFDYAKAYLKIMANYKNKYNWNLMYFDGFAGTGKIESKEKTETKTIDGVASKILSINEPISFDMYYFVELQKQKAKRLRLTIDKDFPKLSDKSHIAQKDCNVKLKDLATFLKSEKGKAYKVLCFIDPFGMQINWNSLENLKNLSIDLWILIPTGVGANRLLKKDGNISEAWLEKLELFLGMPKKLILDQFYKIVPNVNLFGEEGSLIYKEEKAIEKLHEIYSNKLNSIFKFISNPLRLNNSSNSTMYHFLMASNNHTAIKIANDIIKQRYNK